MKCNSKNKAIHILGFVCAYFLFSIVTYLIFYTFGIKKNIGFVHVFIITFTITLIGIAVDKMMN